MVVVVVVVAAAESPVQNNKRGAADGYRYRGFIACNLALGFFLSLFQYCPPPLPLIERLWMRVISRDGAQGYPVVFDFFFPMLCIAKLFCTAKCPSSSSKKKERGELRSRR